MIGADPFENPVPVKQSVIENRNLRIALAVVFSVNVNFHARRTGNYETLSVKATLNREIESLNRAEKNFRWRAIRNPFFGVYRLLWVTNGYYRLPAVTRQVTLT